MVEENPKALISSNCTTKLQSKDGLKKGPRIRDARLRKSSQEISAAKVASLSPSLAGNLVSTPFPHIAAAKIGSLCRQRGSALPLLVSFPA